MSRVSRAIVVYLGVMVMGASYLHLRAAQGPAPAAAPAAPQTAAARPAGQAAPGAPLDPNAVLKQYCVTCHSERLKTAGFVLEGLDARDMTHGDAWERVMKKLRTREMPPTGRPRPDSATYDAMSAYFEKALDTEAITHPNPGRVAVHRLNRTE